MKLSIFLVCILACCLTTEATFDKISELISLKSKLLKQLTASTGKNSGSQQNNFDNSIGSPPPSAYSSNYGASSSSSNNYPPPQQIPQQSPQNAPSGGSPQIVYVLVESPKIQVPQYQPAPQPQVYQPAPPPQVYQPAPPPQFYPSAQYGSAQQQSANSVTAEKQYLNYVPPCDQVDNSNKINQQQQYNNNNQFPVTQPQVRQPATYSQNQQISTNSAPQQYSNQQYPSSNSQSQSSASSSGFQMNPSQQTSTNYQQNQQSTNSDDADYSPISSSKQQTDSRSQFPTNDQGGYLPPSNTPQQSQQKFSSSDQVISDVVDKIVKTNSGVKTQRALPSSNVGTLSIRTLSADPSDSSASVLNAKPNQAFSVANPTTGNNDQYEIYQIDMDHV